MHDVIARYLDCWNETDPAARRKLIGEVWAQDAEYIDPMAEAHGRDAIDATIGAVQDQFPGLVFTLAAGRRAPPAGPLHLGLGPRGGEPLVIGFDVAVTAGNGQIVSVLGFLDKVPG